MSNLPPSQDEEIQQLENILFGTELNGNEIYQPNNNAQPNRFSQEIDSTVQAITGFLFNEPEQNDLGQSAQINQATELPQQAFLGTTASFIQALASGEPNYIDSSYSNIHTNFQTTYFPFLLPHFNQLSVTSQTALCVPLALANSNNSGVNHYAPQFIGDYQQQFYNGLNDSAPSAQSPFSQNDYMATNFNLWSANPTLQQDMSLARSAENTVQQGREQEDSDDARRARIRQRWRDKRKNLEYKKEENRRRRERWLKNKKEQKPKLQGVEQKDSDDKKREGIRQKLRDKRKNEEYRKEENRRRKERLKNRKEQELGFKEKLNGNQKTWHENKRKRDPGHRARLSAYERKRRQDKRNILKNPTQISKLTDSSTMVATVNPMVEFSVPNNQPNLSSTPAKSQKLSRR